MWAQHGGVAFVDRLFILLIGLVAMELFCSPVRGVLCMVLGFSFLFRGVL
jgi:hypothetical protein